MSGIAAIQAQPGLLPRAVGMAVALAAACAADFVPGRLYMVENIVEGCNPLERSLIRELDPTTGNARLFAEIPNGLCGVHYGMTFTPDGQYLRVGEFLRSQVLQIDGDGNVSVALGPADGAFGPFGGNCMTYDPLGNFYLANLGGPAHIRRFSADGSASTVFANGMDGVSDGGALTAATDGSIYYIGQTAGMGGTIIRFDASGAASFLDSGLSYDHTTITVDDRGDVYAWLIDGIYRYRGGAPGSRELVASRSLRPNVVMSFSPVDGLIYLVDEDSTRISALDRDSGILHAVTPGFPQQGFLGTGLAIYVPEPSTLALVLAVLTLKRRFVRVSVRQS